MELAISQLLRSRSQVAAALAPGLDLNGLAAESKGEIPYRILGRTGEKVSIVGVGGWHIGCPSEAEGISIIRTAVDRGINFMDNCWDYHNGDSELRMGKALKNGYRDKVFLMSKIDGRTKKAVTEQIDECLKRLQTDRVDLMQFHEVLRANDPERIFAVSGGMEAMLAAQKAGKVRYIGFTGHKSPAMHLNMLEYALKQGFTFDAVQMPLNVVDAHFLSFEKEVVPVLRKHNIGILGMKPMAAGAILKTGAVTAVECLTYAMSLPVSVVITGCDSMPILQQAIKAAKNFRPMSVQERLAILSKTAHLAAADIELYKTTIQFDATNRNPELMG